MSDERLEQAAERAYLAYFSPADGVAPASWAHLRDEDKQRWRNVASAAGDIGKTVVRISMNPYLTVDSFDWARTILQSPSPEACTVAASSGSASALRKIAALGAKVIELPPTVLASPDAWWMLCPDGCCYSVPS